MKKLFLCVVLFMFTACAGAGTPGASPSDAVTTFLAHVQAGEYDEASAIILGNDPMALADLEEEHRYLFQGLSYVNVTETVSGQRALVTLTITSVDFADVMAQIMADAELFLSIFEDVIYTELFDMVETMMIETITSGLAPTTSGEVTVALEKFYGQWRIIANEDFANAVTGGWLYFVENLGL